MQFIDIIKEFPTFTLIKVQDPKVDNNLLCYIYAIDINIKYILLFYFFEYEYKYVNTINLPDIFY